MSSADAAVGDTVVATTKVRSGESTIDAAAVLAVLALTQLVWIAVLVYAAIWLLT